MLELIDLVRILMSPEVVSEMGPLERLAVSWTPSKKYYAASHSKQDHSAMHGEIIGIHIRMKGPGMFFGDQWQSEFPESKKVYGTTLAPSDLGFVEADINRDSVITSIFSKLSPHLLRQIAHTDEDRHMKNLALNALAKK